MYYIYYVNVIILLLLLVYLPWTKPWKFYIMRYIYIAVAMPGSNILINVNYQVFKKSKYLKSDVILVLILIL